MPKFGRVPYHVNRPIWDRSPRRGMIGTCSARTKQFYGKGRGTIMDTPVPEPTKKRTIPTPDSVDFLVTKNTLCRELGLPKKWLHRVVKEGKLPCLKLGHRLLFNVAAVKDHLSELAESEN